MREWEIGAVENIHGALPYIRFAPILALVGVGVNRIGKVHSSGMTGKVECRYYGRDFTAGEMALLRALIADPERLTRHALSKK